MDDLQKENLVNAGIDLKTALERFMGNEKMLLKYLNRFLNEKSYNMLSEAVQAGNQDAAKSAAHMLKSVCGTIGCVQMQDMVIAQEKKMINHDWEGAVQMMPEIEMEYNRICEALKANLPAA